MFDVPQLVAPGETGRARTLPSFLYFPTEAEIASGFARGEDPTEPVAGILARDHGAVVPSRQVASAKSWLANAAVDRTAAILPWGAEDVARLSPVDASARILIHLRDSWNRDHPTMPLGTLPIVLAVPASFDEEARELTVQAARTAGFERLTLLEEPLAALYAWIAAHRREAARRVDGGALILVCDVGGGTTDFSLIRGTRGQTGVRPGSDQGQAGVRPGSDRGQAGVRPGSDRGQAGVRPGSDPGDVRFERVAIGEHLLLGGDNVDLALAALVEQRLVDAGTPKLTLTQRQILRRKCTAAKEQLLGESPPPLARITVPGSGRGLIAGTAGADLTRDDVIGVLGEGFLPITAPDEHPARDRRIGLRELGLPYESDPAITRHLAAFLSRAGERGHLARPDAVLFNGGFFTPAFARERVLDALASWFGARPGVLENDHPEAAVAIGAAFYGRLRQQPDASRHLLIQAGTARAYYVGVRTATATPSAVCVLPRGTNEGTETVLDRRFSVNTNQPAAFTLYSTTAGHDATGAVIRVDDASALHRHAPLVAVMRYGKRSRSVPLEVQLRTIYTETGTLELWCESATSEHRWRLAFNLRAAESDPLDIAEQGGDEGASSGGDGVLVSDAALVQAVSLIERTFVAGETAPEQLVGDLENAVGFGKQDWPLPALRRLADALLAAAEGRRRSAAHEIRWLNLVGFCARPGFGTALDAWRVSELRKVYAAGLTFPKDVQAQVEWLVLWHRVGAGFSAGQQRELAQRVSGQLGIGQRKPARINPQIEREGWRLLASLERLDSGQRVRLGDALLVRVRREARNAALLWAIGRFGARIPLYGPLNAVVPAPVAERWVEALLDKAVTAEAAVAIAQIAARTDDPARDVADASRGRAAERLSAAGISDDLLLPLREVVPLNRGRASQAFGETLPEGLELAR